MDLTASFLAAHGQGPATINQSETPIHTHKTLQMWLTRAATLALLGLHKQASEELDSFGGFDRPEMFFQFHAAVYPGTHGSMVPFSLRLLYAGMTAVFYCCRSYFSELPLYFESHVTALNRLYDLLRVCRTVISAFRSGATPVRWSHVVINVQLPLHRVAWAHRRPIRSERL